MARRSCDCQTHAQVQQFHSPLQQFAQQLVLLVLELPHRQCCGAAAEALQWDPKARSLKFHKEFSCKRDSCLAVATEMHLLLECLAMYTSTLRQQYAPVVFPDTDTMRFLFAQRDHMQFKFVLS